MSLQKLTIVTDVILPKLCYSFIEISCCCSSKLLDRTFSRILFALHNFYCHFVIYVMLLKLLYCFDFCNAVRYKFFGFPSLAHKTSHLNAVCSLVRCLSSSTADRPNRLKNEVAFSHAITMCLVTGFRFLARWCYASRRNVINFRKALWVISFVFKVLTALRNNGHDGYNLLSEI